MFLATSIQAQTLNELLDKGKEAEQIFDYTSALENYNSAIDLFPSTADPYIFRANLYYILGNYAATKFDCQTALRIDEKRSEPLSLLALVFFIEKDYKKSLEMYDRVIQLRPTNPKLYFARGEVLYLLGLKEQACESWERAQTFGFTGIKGMIETHCGG